MLYHNTTSKYNAYFLARERLKELEITLWRGQKDNFNRILEIYPRIDSNVAKTHKDKLDKIIKNASLPIQWHKPSHWVDDCYLVIGKCRFYDADWENAISTFKYINNKYDDNEVKHEALVWLMRVYMVQQNWESAKDIGQQLEEEFMSIPNVARFSMAYAHYHIHQKEYRQAYEKLKLGVKYIKPREFRAKMVFVLAQLAHKAEDRKEAYSWYKLCARMNTNYELWFYSKLNMYQLKNIENAKDANKILKRYNKMLKDLKNTDYKDRIYYEMGNFEVRRDSLDNSLKYYKLSVRNAKTGTFVKSFAYLRIAEIHYDKRQEFEKAKLYYDSTVAILEKDLEEYPKAKKRQRVLADFVEQLRIVKREDSLQALAKLDSASLSRLIDERIAEEEKRLKEEARLQKKLARQMADESSLDPNAPPGAFSAAAPTTPNTGGDNRWYFYNPVVLEAGKQEFARKWGSRPLEDNWRRVNKEREDANVLEAQNEKVSKKDSALQAATEASNKIPKQLSETKKKFYENIPLTPALMDSSVSKLKVALFKLARIYDFGLEEYPNAAKTYARFFDTFPEEDRAPEGVYANYLIFKNKYPNDSQALYHKELLLSKYPKSLYAKLLLNPNYLVENKLMGEKVKFMYRQAFELYEASRYFASDEMCNKILTEFPESDFEDRVRILKIMIIGSTQPLQNYIDALTTYLKDFPKSSLKAYAEDLKVKAEKHKEAENIQASLKRMVFSLDLDYKHYFCVVVPKKHETTLKTKFADYHTEFYTDQLLQTESLALSDTSVMLTIKDFPNKIQALNYFEKQRGASSPLKVLPNPNVDFFVISSKNYEMVEHEKIYQPYLEFFKKNY